MTEQAQGDGVPAEVVAKAIDEALGGVLEGDFFVRAEGTFRSSGGHEEDYAFDSWRLAFLGYDESGVIDPGEQLFEFGSADVVVAHDGYDADAVRLALDDHSQWYADIGGQLYQPDGMPWESLMAEADSGGRGDVLFVMDVQLQDAWRGHGLTGHLLDAITSNPIARTSALTVVRPLVWTEHGEHDVEATAKLTAAVEAAGFTRHYSSELFLRSNTDEALPDTSIEPDPTIGWRRSGVGLMPLFIPYFMTEGPLAAMGYEDARAIVTLPVPQQPAATQLPPPQGVEINYDPEDDALLASDALGTLVSRIGTDGAPALIGEAEGTRKPLGQWMLAVHRDLHESLPGARAAINEIADDLLAGRTPRREPNEPEFQAPDVGGFGERPSPFPADARVVVVSDEPWRAQLVCGGNVLGVITERDFNVEVAIAPDETRSEEATTEGLAYLVDQGAALVIRDAIRGRLQQQVFEHLTASAD